MPASVKHEVLVDLFRKRPELAAELVQGVLGVKLPAYTTVRTGSADFSQVVSTEYRADQVVVLARRRPVAGVIVEVQMAPDPDKLWSWPVYVTTERAELRCPVCLLVVTPYERVARWARRPIEIGAGSQVKVLVAGPEAIPAIVDARRARKNPELAVLSATAHGRDADYRRAARAALAAMKACFQLDLEHATLYADVVRAALGRSARAALEALMQSPEHREFQSAFARKYTALGRAQGEAKGKAEGKAEAVLAVLRARGLKVTRQQRTRILACKDAARLDRWLERAATASSVDKVVSR